jgi:serine/threonine protein phosphatase 1
MLWIREEHNKFEFTKGKIIIHGHTPIPFKQIKLRIENKNTNVINIDSGCVFTQLPNLGGLTALNIDTKDLLNIKNIDF